MKCVAKCREPQTFAFHDPVVEDDVYSRCVILRSRPVVGRHVFRVFFAEIIAIIFIVGCDFGSSPCRETDFSSEIRVGAR